MEKRKNNQEKKSARWGVLRGKEDVKESVGVVCHEQKQHHIYAEEHQWRLRSSHTHCGVLQGGVRRVEWNWEVPKGGVRNAEWYRGVPIQAEKHPTELKCATAAEDNQNWGGGERSVRSNIDMTTQTEVRQRDLRSSHRQPRSYELEVLSAEWDRSVSLLVEKRWKMRKWLQNGIEEHQPRQRYVVRDWGTPILAELHCRRGYQAAN